MAQNPFDAFLRNNRFKVATHGSYYDDRAQCPRPSHNDLFGGMLIVDDSDPDIETEFHHMLLTAIDSGRLFGLSENRTQFSALYFDLDFKGREVVDKVVLVRIVQIIRQVLRRAGGEDFERVSSALIATSPSAPEQNLMVKTGVHIVFPHIVLGLSSMQIINVAARDAVEAEMGPRQPPLNSWSDVFDLGVYRGGLRMLYVDKPTQCPSCQTPPCSKLRCVNGYVGQKRPYVPVAYVNARDGMPDDAVMQRLAADRVFALGMFTIRRPKARRESPKSPVFDASFPTPAEIAALRVGGPQTGTHHAHASTTASATNSQLLPSARDLANKHFVLSTDRARIEILQKLIREFEPSRFGHILVRQALVNHAGTQYMVQVQGPGRHACMNCLPGQTHSRSTVFFVVDALRGVSQRCNSKSDKVETRATRKPCKLFRSPSVPFSIANQALTRDILFASMQVVSSLRLLVDNGNVLCMDPQNYVPEGEHVDLEDADDGDGDGHGNMGGEPRVRSGIRIKPVAGVERQQPVYRNSTAVTIGTFTPHSAHTIDGATSIQPAAPPGGRGARPGLAVRETSTMSDAELGIPLSWRIHTRKRTSSSSHSHSHSHSHGAAGEVSGGSGSGSSGSGGAQQKPSSKLSSIQVLLSMAQPDKKQRSGGR